ncbi:hypothetical protein LC613_14225 [Nostoc sphaeroides CHAB 2801]|uniref:hypothetical protein n=1 Tax=Nostoc sphaeroides TaxID=446679 RepID=UPI001E3E77E3|nr:hypothetical protein [Nostoc sphaeroides]MCC5629167.1 hypothetical protein [Nostoc sphaeroides CHAB 2801]
MMLEHAQGRSHKKTRFSFSKRRDIASVKGLPSKKIFHCYCSLLTVDGSRVFSQQSTTLMWNNLFFGVP